MSAKDFNSKMIEDGEFTIEHITRLVQFWQTHHGLTVDGYAGANTLSSILPIPVVDAKRLYKVFPLKKLPDGRDPQVTSGFHTDNSSRSKHMGLDFFYKWLESDPDVFSGKGGAIKKNGKRRWWYPDGAVAVAAAGGIVQKAGLISRGYRVWIDHGNGERTGYFHGAGLLVKEGDKVLAGDPVIVVGDNPNGGYKKHLHFEVSPVDRYAPMNPRKWLVGAVHLPDNLDD